MTHAFDRMNPQSYFTEEARGSYTLKHVGCYSLGHIYTVATRSGETKPFAAFESRALHLAGNEEDGEGVFVLWESVLERDGIFSEPSGNAVSRTVRESLLWEDPIGAGETFSIEDADGQEVEYPVHHREFIDTMIGALSMFGLVEGLETP